MTPGTVIAAGQVVGTRAVEFRQGADSVALGVMHPTRRVGFISPDRYTDDVLHAVSPLDYYAEPALGQDTFYLEADSGPAVAEVSPASGVVTYRFPYWSGNSVVIRVQMLSDTSVRAEKYDARWPAGGLY